MEFYVQYQELNAKVKFQYQELNSKVKLTKGLILKSKQLYQNIEMNYTFQKRILLIPHLSLRFALLTDF